MGNGDQAIGNRQQAVRLALFRTLFVCTHIILLFPFVLFDDCLLSSVYCRFGPIDGGGEGQARTLAEEPGLGAATRKGFGEGHPRRGLERIYNIFVYII